MDISFLDSDTRPLLAIAVVLGAGLAVLAWRFRVMRSAIVPATLLSALGALTLAAEWVMARVVHANAPTTSDFNEYHWVLLSPWQRPGLIVGLLAVAAIVALAWRASARVASPWRRAALIGLRCAAAVTALFLFVQPAVELRQVAREPNRIAILVDTSQSMDLREQPDGPSRIERARALIDASAGTFARWRERHHVDFFRFADVLAPSSLARIAVDQPTGPSTLVRQALEQVREFYDANELAGVVLISDGVATGGFAHDRGRDGGEALGVGLSGDFLEALDTRVHTVWAGQPGLADVAIARVLVDEFAFVRTVVRIEVEVRATGYDSRRIPITLSSGGRPLREKWVTIGPGDTEESVVFELSPPRVGKFVYEISTPIADDEAVAENNRRAFVLQVIRDKIRVLQVSGQPSWDVRALRRMLEQNPNVDLISFFILRTHDDHSMVPNSEMSLIPFPTRELFEQELPSFDVIVMQNFDFGPYGIGVYLENIRSYVEGGGGFIMLGGRLSFSSGGYSVTPLAAALPVDLPTRFRSWRELIDPGKFQPRLTDEGKEHPVTALRYETRDNLAAWQSLPKLEGVNVLAGAKKNATVLAVHPRLRTRSGDPMPVIVAGEYGKGRTMAVATDSLWRWGFVAAAEPGDDGRHYDKLWENTIRWLIQDPDLHYLHVHSDAVEYPPGAVARVDLRLLARDYTPLSKGEVALAVTREQPGGEPESVLKDTVTVNEAGRYSVDLVDLRPGIYRVSATAELDQRPAVANDIFLVREASSELDQPAANQALLRQISGATGARHLASIVRLPADLPFAEPRIVRVDRRADVELWSRPGLLLLAFLLLGVEWVLRQQSGYL